MTQKNPKSIWIASFDIGKRNFCFYIEEINYSFLLSIKDIPNKKKYNIDGTPTTDMAKILDQICKNGKTILHKNSDLTKNTKKGSYLDQEIFYNMNDLLDKFGEYWDRCSYFVVEMQMSFRKKYNTMAVKLGQHCQSYFYIRYGRFSKKVIEFPAYHKTQVLGAAKIRGTKYKNGKYRWKAINKSARKNWGIKKATEILEKRGEIDAINNIKTKSKKDDLADTIIQLQAFKYIYFVTNK